MDLDRGAVQRHGLDLDTDNLSMLQTLEHPIQYASPRPSAHAGIDRVPSAKALGQAAPLAALLGDVQDGVKNLQVREADIPALARQAVLNQAVLGFGEFHVRSIPKFLISVNTPCL